MVSSVDDSELMFCEIPRNEIVESRILFLNTSIRCHLSCPWDTCGPMEGTNDHVIQLLRLNIGNKVLSTCFDKYSIKSLVFNVLVHQNSF